MQDFYRQYFENLMECATDDEHRLTMRRFLTGFKDMLGLMAGTAALPAEPVGPQEKYDAMLDTLLLGAAESLRGKRIKVVPLSQLQSLPGERHAYDAIMLSVLTSDYIMVASLHGTRAYQETNAFVTVETRLTVPGFFGKHLADAMKHFDQSMLVEIMRGYPMVATMAMIAMKEKNWSAVRSLAPKAQFLALGLPIGSPKNDPESFYILSNA